MKIREGLVKNNQGTNKVSSDSYVGNQPAKVFGIVLDENTPSPEMFEKVGGWDGIGTIFYLDYNSSKKFSEVDLNKCKIAKPLASNEKNYPLLGEIVMIYDLPSYQEGNTISQKYYSNPISTWNNNHHNAQSPIQDIVLGKTFKENGLIKSILPGEGDLVLEGRFGNAIRFGSSYSLKQSDNNPLITLVNNHNFDKSPKWYIENINNDGSSIYLTSAQIIDLKTDFTDLNKFTNTTAIAKYNKNQIFLNADRLVLNSKLDEVLIFGKTNIELYTKGIISLLAEERIHLDSSLVFLGRNKSKLPNEPVLLGDKTIRVINDIISELSKFSSSLTSTVSPPAGSPIMDLNAAAAQLNTKLKKIASKLGSLTSEQVYVS